MKTSYVYIITNQRNGTLYVGVTNNISRRVFEHKNKLIEGFSKQYSLDKLVYVEQFVNISDAIASEKTIKGWKRIKKLALIEESNPNWQELDSSCGQNDEERDRL